MARALIVSHSWLASILPPKVKFNQGDVIEFKGGLVLGGSGGSGGSGGLEPPA